MAIGGRVIFGILLVAPGIASAQHATPLQAGILTDLNQLRGDPGGYAAVLRKQRRYYQGNILAIPGLPEVLTQEGVRPLEEAIEVLRSMPGGLGLLTLSSGLSHAAADHARDTGRLGLTGHAGSDGSDFTRRIERYGKWSGAIGEEWRTGPIGEACSTPAGGMWGLPAASTRVTGRCA
jgi:uncharacterized protein YkwD